MKQILCEYYERVVLSIPAVLNGQDFPLELASHLNDCPVCGQLLSDRPLSVRLRESLTVLTPAHLAHTVSTRVYAAQLVQAEEEPVGGINGEPT